MRNAKLLLQKLTELYPPSGAQRHNLTLADGLLEVTLFQDGLWYSFKFGDEELEDSVDTFVADIREAMDARLAGVANEPEVLRDLLSLVMPNPPEIEVVESWAPEVRSEVTSWAVAEMSHASDNGNPRLPRPGVLPSPEGIKRHPPDGYFNDDDEHLPCTCAPDCDQPCRGLESGCNCIACEASYQDYLSHPASSQ